MSTVAVLGATDAAKAGAAHVVEATAYDAILLASFGGPEGQDDVIPFLRNVTRGRGIPEERLEEVAHHYRAFGGVSPINDQNRELKAALEAELARRGVDLPVLWGNRNWTPYLRDALTEADERGFTKLIAIGTSAYSSYSSCRQYREDYAQALADTGLEGVIEIDKVRQFFDHPGFVEPFIEGVRDALSQVSAAGIPAEQTHVLFSTHSIPSSDAARSGPPERDFGEGGAYAAQHLAVAEVVMSGSSSATAMSGSSSARSARIETAGDDVLSGSSSARSARIETVGDEGFDAVAGRPTQPAGAGQVAWSLVYQSRSGPPSMPWLAPDVNEAIIELGNSGVKAVVIVPIGFVSDHMEVKWDLDTEAMETAQQRGILAIRVPTPGAHAAYVSGLVDLVLERRDGVPVEDRPAMTTLGPWYDVCRAGCCENVRMGFKPALAGVAP